jgi:hypothetical protein
MNIELACPLKTALVSSWMNHIDRASVNTSGIFYPNAGFSNHVINGGAIIDHEAPRERRFVAVEK